MEFGKLGKGRDIYDIERKIKLKEAKLQLLFWGGIFFVVIVVFLLMKYILDVELIYVLLTGFALAFTLPRFFFRSKTMNKRFEQIQILEKERDLLKRLMDEERMAFSGKITLITNEVVKSDFFIEDEKEVFDKKTNIGYLKDKIVSLERYKYNSGNL
ncbi:hypothetical protein ACI75W_08975 [Capnocytophaga canis]